MSNSPDREQLIRNFLAPTIWSDAVRKHLAGDASNRDYARLTNPDTGKTVVLMNAPPQKGEDVRPFVHIARFLSAAGLSAPEVYHVDETNGLLLLEDLGDALFANIVKDGAVSEPTLYRAAIDSLVRLHQLPVPAGVTAYSPDLMAELSLRSFDWYLFGACGIRKDTAKTAFKLEMSVLLHSVFQSEPVLALRDFHSENLIWLPERDGIKRVGLLDFQDAMSCHPAYDLASLLHDARRDVLPGLKEKMIARYVSATRSDQKSFETTFSVLSAQRNLRIIGGFSRLSMKFGKPAYLGLLPRVWRHLLTDLEHPKLEKLRNLVLTELPAPTNDVIKVLKNKCATAPNL